MNKIFKLIFKYRKAFNHDIKPSSQKTNNPNKTKLQLFFRKAKTKSNKKTSISKN